MLEAVPAADEHARTRAVEAIREQTNEDCNQLFGPPAQISDGTHHTSEELERRLKLAWLNSDRCIGRLFFNQLCVLDYREARTDEEIRDGLLTHLATAKNEPYRSIKPVASVFDPSVKIINSELLEYAGWQDGSEVIGDRKNLQLTALAEANGWHPKRGQYTLLPLMWHKGDGEMTVAPIPEQYNGQSIRQEIELEHPDPSKTWLNDMRLRWFWGPFISDRRVFMDGQSYTAPFSGYYQHEEIARDLLEPSRYALLEKIGEQMCRGWDIDLQRSDGWKHEVATLVNTMVEYSYQRDRVQTVSSIASSKQFVRLMEDMRELDFPLPHDYGWIRSSMPAFQTEHYHHAYPVQNVDPPLHGPFFYHPEEMPDPVARYMQGSER